MNYPKFHHLGFKTIATIYMYYSLVDSCSNVHLNNKISNSLDEIKTILKSKD